MFVEGYFYVMMFNNDIWVLKGFVVVLFDLWLLVDVGMVGLMFDVGFFFVVVDEKLDVESYVL